jgi:hypothetical protein
VNNLTTIKARYNIAQAWRDLGLAGEPGKNCRSPYPGEHKHGDANPSFSVFDDSRRWKNFANGEGGDVIDFVAKMLGCNVADAIRWIQGRLGIPHLERQPEPTKKTSQNLPALRAGTAEELRALAEHRGFATEALQLAESRGFLRFCNLWGIPAWCVGDQRQQLHEFRRLDGQPWPAFGRLPARKAHCTGTGKNWPLGILESQPFQKIVMVEGAPDFLAAFQFLLVEGKEKTVAPVAVLGAANHALAPDALAMLAGKQVCLYPHADEAGQKAMRAWARALRTAHAARVTAFDLSGLVLVDGTTGKDLADVARISADCFEREHKFLEVLP